MTKYEKLKLSLRYFLLGMSNSNPDYIKCVEALEYASKFHKGKRKDGVTPEFEHQLIITHYIRTILGNLMYPVETICTSLLHDVPEDYDVSFEEIEYKFGTIVSTSVEKTTKIYRGVKKTNEVYFDGISKDPIASVTKGGDRIHNLQSMIGVFNIDKQKDYITEAENWILPSIKEARRNFPSQEMAYENIKFMMESQISLIKSTWTL